MSASTNPELLWYLPNFVETGHRGDTASPEDGYGTLDYQVVLAERGDVLVECLYTAPGKYGGGGAGTTWLVGSADDVAAALSRYQELGVSHFVLSGTPYRTEVARVGEALIPRLRQASRVVLTSPNGVRRA